MKQQLYTILIALFLCTVPAMAYVDPATGSFLLQFAFAGIMGVAFYVKTFWRTICSKLGLGKPSTETDDNFG